MITCVKRSKTISNFQTHFSNFYSKQKFFVAKNSAYFSFWNRQIWIIITIKISKNIKTELEVRATFSKKMSNIFVKISTKSFEFNNFFAIRQRRVEIIKSEFTQIELRRSHETISSNTWNVLSKNRKIDVSKRRKNIIKSNKIKIKMYSNLWFI